MDRTTLEKSFNSTKLLIKQHSQRYEALDSDNSGFEPAASSSNSTAIRSSTVSFTSDSRMTGGSDTLAARILRSSSNDTDLQDLSNRGLLDMMRKRCSRRVCSRPSNDPTSCVARVRQYLNQRGTDDSLRIRPPHVCFGGNQRRSP